MKKHWYLLLGWLFLFPWACFGQNQDWLEVTAQDRRGICSCAQDVKLPSTRFVTARSFANNQFVSKRALVVNGIMFRISEYPELKGFFDKVQGADEEQLVLQNTAVITGK